MSSQNRNVNVIQIRLQWSDKAQLTSYTKNVTVGTPKDPDTKTTYIRIAVNRETILSEELNEFEWLDKSSTDGVVTIRSNTVKIVIIYNSADRSTQGFFTEMKRLLTSRSTPEPSPPPRPNPPLKPQISGKQQEQATKDLLESIRDGRSKDVKKPAEFLAQTRTNVQFSLNTDNDNEKSGKTTNSAGAKPSNVLQLTLRIECHLNQDPIIAPITVSSGTTLRNLKDQIESETGIKRKDQYWFAFERFIIDDEYKFGSSDPVVPPPRKNTPKSQEVPPTDPIRNGDTLIMYIAQTPSFDK